MENLPIEIALDILSRLPADTVLECKRVCKAWGNLLSVDKANFVAMHLSRQTQNHHDHNNGIRSLMVSLGLIFLLNRSGYQLCYGEYDELNISDDHNEQCMEDKPRSLNHPLLRTRRVNNTKSLVGSCNGLICLAEPRTQQRYDFQDPIHICNPITRECLCLEGFNENKEYGNVRKIYSGFGYSPQTCEYKVVRIIRTKNSDRGDIQVYTLGGGTGWRNKGEIKGLLISEYGVFVDGAIHWIGRKGKHIMAFNLSDEKFHALPLPAGPFQEDAYYQFNSILGSTEEWLCASACRDVYSSRCLDIWTYKKTPPEKSIAATDSKGESCTSWCKEFTITLENSSVNYYSPLAVTRGGLVLLKHNAPDAEILFCYDPKSATMKKLGIWNTFEAILHTNSFVSLKALGETTCKKRKRRQKSSSGAKGLAS